MTIVGHDGKPIEESKEAPPKEPECLSEEVKTCGCLVRKMDNKTVEVRFCPPHAIQQASIALGNAAGALRMAADRLIEDQQAMVAKEQLRQGKRAVDKGMKRFLRGKLRRS